MKLNSLLMFLILTAVVGTSVQAELYRWVDASGRVHYSDRVPPEYAKRGHETLNKNARRIETVRPEKTAEELEQERLETLRKQELEKIVQAERARDATLLKTFGSIADIDRIMNDRLELLQSKINLIQGKIGKVVVKLKQSEKKKSTYVEQEKLAPRQLIDNIDKYRTQIDEWQEKIREYKQAQDDTYERFTSDRLRLIELHEIKSKSVASEY